MAIDRTIFLNGLSNLTGGTHSRWKVGDVIFLVFLIILNIPVYFAKPFERQFIINDPTIAHPYAEVQTVGDGMLFVYSLLLPTVVIISVWILFTDRRHRWYLLYISLLGLYVTFFSNLLFTTFIKNWIGRLRPDFLDRCQPMDNLPLNTLLNPSEVCTTKNTERLLEGFRTTPSGHSSESFAGLGFLYYWLSGQFLSEYVQASLWAKFVSVLPLVGASVIALSRTQDYRHHFVDVLIGSLVGFIFATYIYKKYFPSIDSEYPFKPLQDDSDVFLSHELHHQRLPQSDDTAL
ncbi:hypothetical protein Kpol_1055p26 [Vanderwaltozyma polyspora DSM 70294]|uniref:Phosphatidic acid phosphatase type 2/haloperoxidase domain-containing protein n=1 Tax=Vanderwaltozyma polyspora (strain ATCC 22028 / DSM 70294 / BCRC 21397 / CBS 2163 / NBRC 10782 / NRRL Y-8283 / UCD 57-17) TaxID=436907 RepID=A7TGA1_VANPO|nr:uncharacterized protein Kpol_1055p26 [Vanderwaltozyma polyspora DSM 70294]EDO18671.1 hypothetical protein Kpol_1055p26 [Vanderwaltozyma polyspora DSM 70294]